MASPRGRAEEPFAPTTAKRLKVEEALVDDPSDTETTFFTIDVWETVCKFINPLDATNLDAVCLFFSTRQVGHDLYHCVVDN